MSTVINLVPLSSEHHVEALQGVYKAVPSFWNMYGRQGAPDGQALRDLVEVESTPGRIMMGIVRRLQEDNPTSGQEMIGVVDFRMQWTRQDTVYLAMVMVAESMQRQGIGSEAWRLHAVWFRDNAGLHTVRLGVEQFNTSALRFFNSIGFQLTGDASRIRVGDKWIRLLYMEQDLA
jgi:RimJ/RimL family protein N-acetyltransferase